MNHDHPEILALLTPEEWKLMRDARPWAERQRLRAEGIRHRFTFVKAQATSVVELVASVFHVRPCDILGYCRAWHFIRPRQLCMYLLRDGGRRTCAEVGRMLGNRDHTTVVHGVQQVEILREKDEAFRALVAALQTQIEKSGLAA